MLKIGEVGKFIVKRETDISYTLAPEDPDLTNYIFLHFNQATRRLSIGETIDAFLYYDGKKRLCATMESPIITTQLFDFVEVVNQCEAGVFVNIGIAKDILLSTDYLPTNPIAWPKVGEKIPCILKEKKEQLVARIISKEDLKQHKIPPLEVGTTVSATVCRLTSTGIGLYTNAFQYIYVHKSMTRKKYHLGESVDVHIIHINEHLDVNGSMIAQKELSRLDDARVLLKELESFGGVLPLGNLSTPEEIARHTHMSKSAFKRAVGALYKERKIQISDYRIELVQK